MTSKKDIRDFYIKIRSGISPSEKDEFDKTIFTKFVNSSFFYNYDTFLIYISVKNEVGTVDIMNYLFAKNKKVAVPYCNSSEMIFYYINSVDELKEGKFGIPSVDVLNSKKVTDFFKTLCIVPGVSFDNKGNRLGYGGGYYDRFLSKHNLPSLGLTYERCISSNIPCEDFDVKIDTILTEYCLRNHKKEEVSTYG